MPEYLVMDVCDYHTLSYIDSQIEKIWMETYFAYVGHGNGIFSMLSLFSKDILHCSFCNSYTLLEIVYQRIEKIGFIVHRDRLSHSFWVYTVLLLCTRAEGTWPMVNV